MTTCPECGRNISIFSSHCLGCGWPVPGKTAHIAQGQIDGSSVSNRRSVPGERPLLLTILCVIGFLASPIGILASFSVLLPAPLLLLAKSIIALVCYIGMWNMKRWAVVVYGLAIGAINILEYLMFQNVGAFLVDLIFPGLVLAAGIYCYDRMT